MTGSIFLGDAMFETPPEKPSQFALYWVGLITLAGGMLGVVGAAFLFGQEWFQKDAVMFGSFLVGTGLGGAIGWRFVMRKGTSSQG